MRTRRNNKRPRKKIKEYLGGKSKRKTRKNHRKQKRV